MTRTTFLLTTLLVGLLGIGTSEAANAIKTSMGDTRLAWAPEDGCIPGSSLTFRCPLRMDCFKDANFKKGGYCMCKPLFLNTLRKLPFDSSSEWDDGFDSSDCASWSFAKFIVGACHLGAALWAIAGLHTNVLVSTELFRNKALKMNATTYALVFSFCGLIAIGCCHLIYWLNTWDMEPEYFYNRRAYIFIGTLACNVTADTEIGCTWIDLVDRTQKMSKSTSRNLKILRATISVLGIAVTAIMIQGILSGSIKSLLAQAVYPAVFSGIFIIVAGVLIVRTICPNLKDTSNPNWKVAQSIVRTTKHSALGKCCEVLSLFVMLNTAKRPHLAYAYAIFNFLYFFGYLFRVWSYISYIITGNRKHLRKYEGDQISGFFGLSTIGLNKTITKASSAFSSRASSVASSVAEKD